MQSVVEAQRAWVDQAEAMPDDWFRTDYKAVLKDVAVRVADMIDADPQGVRIVLR